MSSITRIMMGLPQLPTDKVKTKNVGKYIFTRVTKPNGNEELSIIEKTDKGLKLLKSTFINERGSSITKTNKYQVFIDKRSGRIFDLKA